MKKLLALILFIPSLTFAATDYDQKKNRVTTKYLSSKPEAWGMYINGVKTHIKTDKRIIALTFDACGGSGGKKFDSDLIKFLLDRLIKALHSPVCLRMPDLDPRMLDLVELQEELVCMFVPLPTIFGTVVAEHPEHPDAMFIEEWQQPIVEKVSCSQGCPVKVDLCKTNI